MEAFSRVTLGELLVDRRGANPRKFRPFALGIDFVGKEADQLGSL